MRTLLAALAAVVLLAPAAAGGQEVETADRAAIRRVIERQLDAFARDAAGEAFSYASPDIKRKFGTPANFMRMVRRGYAPVYRPRAHAFAGFRVEDGRPTQTVRFVGPEGRAVLADYFMERQPDGRWLIDGVVLYRPPERVS